MPSAMLRSKPPGRVFTPGTATEGESNGHLVLDSWSCQAVTPRDEESVDYYYSWGVSKATEQPGLADLLKEGLDVTFAEDKQMLEAQQQRIQEDPHFKQMGIGAADGAALPGGAAEPLEGAAKVARYRGAIQHRTVKQRDTEQFLRRHIAAFCRLAQQRQHAGVVALG